MTVEQLAAAVKTELDKVRADADKAAAAVASLDDSVLGEILTKIPKVGPVLEIVLQGAALADKLIDAVDNVVDGVAK